MDRFQDRAAKYFRSATERWWNRPPSAQSAPPPPIPVRRTPPAAAAAAVSSLIASSSTSAASRFGASAVPAAAAAAAARHMSATTAATTVPGTTTREQHGTTEVETREQSQHNANDINNIISGGDGQRRQHRQHHHHHHHHQYHQSQFANQLDSRRMLDESFEPQTTSDEVHMARNIDDSEPESSGQHYGNASYDTRSPYFRHREDGYYLDPVETTPSIYQDCDADRYSPTNEPMVPGVPYIGGGGGGEAVLTPTTPSTTVSSRRSIRNMPPGRRNRSSRRRSHRRRLRYLDEQRRLHYYEQLQRDEAVATAAAVTSAAADNEDQSYSSALKQYEERERDPDLRYGRPQMTREDDERLLMQPSPSLAIQHHHQHQQQPQQPQASTSTISEQDQERLTNRRKLMAQFKTLNSTMNVPSEELSSRFGQSRPYVHNYSLARYRPRPPNFERSNTEPASQTVQPFNQMTPTATDIGLAAAAVASATSNLNSQFEVSSMSTNPSHYGYGTSSSASSLLLMMMPQQNSQSALSNYADPSGGVVGGGGGAGSVTGPTTEYYSASSSSQHGHYLGGSNTSISSTGTGFVSHHGSLQRLLPPPPLKLAGTGPTRPTIYTSQSVDECSTGMAEGADLVTILNRSSLEDVGGQQRYPSSAPIHGLGVSSNTLGLYPGGHSYHSRPGVDNVSPRYLPHQSSVSPSLSTPRNPLRHSSLSVDNQYLDSQSVGSSSSPPLSLYSKTPEHMSYHPVTGAGSSSSALHHARLLPVCSDASVRYRGNKNARRYTTGPSSLRVAGSGTISLSSSPIDKDEELYNGMTHYGQQQQQQQQQQHKQHRLSASGVRRRQLPTIKSFPLLTNSLTNLSNLEQSMAAAAAVAPTYQPGYTNLLTGAQQTFGASTSAAEQCYGNYGTSMPITTNNTGRNMLSVPSLCLTHSSTEALNDLGSDSTIVGGNYQQQQPHHHQRVSLPYRQPPPTNDSTLSASVQGGRLYTTSPYRMTEMPKQYSFDNAELSRTSPFWPMGGGHDGRKESYPSSMSTTPSLYSWHHIQLAGESSPTAEPPPPLAPINFPKLRSSPVRSRRLPVPFKFNSFDERTHPSAAATGGGTLMAHSERHSPNLYMDPRAIFGSASTSSGPGTSTSGQHHPSTVIMMEDLRAPRPPQPRYFNQQLAHRSCLSSPPSPNCVPNTMFIDNNQSEPTIAGAGVVVFTRGGALKDGGDAKKNSKKRHRHHHHEKRYYNHHRRRHRLNTQEEENSRDDGKEWFTTTFGVKRFSLTPNYISPPLFPSLANPRDEALFGSAKHRAAYEKAKQALLLPLPESAFFEKLNDDMLYLIADFNDQIEHEDFKDYGPGGYHPIKMFDLFNNRYSAICKLGWGHFSTVWLSWDLKDEKYVAIKVVKSSMHYTETACDEIMILKTIRDAEVDLGIDSHIVQLLDYFVITGIHGDHVCMVFEVLGSNLLDLIIRANYNGIPLENVRTIMRQVLQGLDFLHRLSIIHTDIKPENILLDISDRMPHVLALKALYRMHMGLVLPRIYVCNTTQKQLKLADDFRAKHMEKLEKEQEKNKKEAEKGKETKEENENETEKKEVKEAENEAKKETEKETETKKKEEGVEMSAARAEVFSRGPVIDDQTLQKWTSFEGRPYPEFAVKILKNAEETLNMLKSTAPLEASADIFDVKVKIGDLGNACWETNHFCDDIQTRQYRAPEVLLDIGYCHTADIWSVGCMAFELATGDYLFDPKSTSSCSRDEDHLARMVELLGPFPEFLADHSVRFLKFFTKEGALKSRSFLPYNLFSLLSEKHNWPDTSAALFSHFLEMLLDYEAQSRSKAFDCLQHPFMRESFPYSAQLCLAKNDDPSLGNPSDTDASQYSGSSRESSCSECSKESFGSNNALNDEEDKDRGYVRNYPDRYVDSDDYLSRLNTGKFSKDVIEATVKMVDYYKQHFARRPMRRTIELRADGSMYYDRASRVQLPNPYLEEFVDEQAKKEMEGALAEGHRISEWSCQNPGPFGVVEYDYDTFIPPLRGKRGLIKIATASQPVRPLAPLTGRDYRQDMSPPRAIITTNSHVGGRSQQQHQPQHNQGPAQQQQQQQYQQQRGPQQPNQGPSQHHRNNRRNGNMHLYENQLHNVRQHNTFAPPPGSSSGSGRQHHHTRQ